MADTTANRTLSGRLAARVPPLAALVVAVLAVSTSAILIRWSGAPSLVKAFYRVLFTTLLLGPLAFSRHGADLRSLGRRDGVAAAVTGVALAVHFAAWFQSVEWTSVAASVTLVQAQPVFVAVGAAFLLGERLTRRKLAGIGVAMAGIVAMSAGDLLGGGAVGPRPLAGNALAVVGAVMMAAYVLAGRSLRARVALVPYVTVVYAACAVVLGALAVARGAPLFGYPPVEWGLFLAMAVGPGVFGHTVINWALGTAERLDHTGRRSRPRGPLRARWGA
jgi:drug/metabolite transporter (DMT)-like permease